MGADTRTTSATQTVTGTHIVKTFRQMMTEVETVAQHATRLGAAVPGHNLEAMLLDISLFALFDIIAAVELRFVRNGVVERKYEYRIADGPLAPAGPAPTNPPLPVAETLTGVRLHLVVTKNPAVSNDEFDARLAARGWGTAAPAVYADNLVGRQYGTFASGGFAVRRILHAPETPKPTPAGHNPRTGEPR
jgi:hypothetical protein